MTAGLQRQTALRFCVLLIAGLLTLSASSSRVAAHCQVPCGIYDDDGRIQMMLEDTRTIQKATASIQELAGKTDALSQNQLSRWVATKEQHASHIITTVAEYFLTQKVKPVAHGENGYEDYLAHLADHHAVMVAAMRTKQQVDVATVAKLQEAIDTLGKHYAH
jgi:nickel superoxide dismutase